LKRIVLLTSFVLASVTIGLGVSTLFQSTVLGKAATSEAPHIGEGGLPQFEVDPVFPHVPAKWRMGFGVNVAVDSDGNVWILTRPSSIAHSKFSRNDPNDPPPDLTSTAAPPVMEFDSKGNFIRGWGGQDGPGYEWPSLEHGINIDSKGFVWICGNADGKGNNPTGLRTDNQVLKFTKDGKFVMAIGKNGQVGSNSTEVLSGADDMAYYAPTNELFVADGDTNSRVMVYDADTGQFKRMWGAYGNKPLDKEDRPSDPMARGLCPDCPIGQSGSFSALRQFAMVHSIVISSDGLVYIGERGNKRVQVFTTDGKFVAEQFVGMSIPGAKMAGSGEQGNSVALSPDERFLYVSGTPVMHILNRKTLEVLGSIPNPGNPYHANHSLAVDREGNIYMGNFQNEPIGKVGGQGAYKLNFKGYASRVACPPCEPTQKVGP
jgi:NHL repeat